MLFHVVTIIMPNFDFQKRLGIDVRSGHRCDTEENIGSLTAMRKNLVISLTYIESYSKCN